MTTTSYWPLVEPRSEWDGENGEGQAGKDTRREIVFGALSEPPRTGLGNLVLDFCHSR